jgi:2-iminoacetate synthase
MNVESIIAKAANLEPLSLEDFSVLISAESAAYLDMIKKTAFDLSMQRHGKIMQIYAPLYVSNECSNSCLYCGFNVHNKMERITLSPEEIKKEAMVIKNMGIEHLLLVSGELKDRTGLDYIAGCVKEIAGMFSYISVEIAPMGTEEYRELNKAGVEGVVCYQETYDRDLFKKYHPYGPKSDYDYRMDTLDRAGAAGMRWLGIGALLGLSDFRKEAVAIATHARYLQKKYWRSAVTVSFPRIRPAEGGFVPPCSVSDEELLQMIAALRLFLPDAVLVLSTRESASFRDKAVFYGINQMSAGSRTNPLGYSNHTVHTGEQFGISDHRTPAEIKTRLQALGYDPVFKNWDRGFRI